MDQEPEPELIENIIPIGQRRTLLELNEDTCRWPIGDPATPEFFFCGGKPLDGLPYCSYHSRVAYQPANDAPRPRPPFASAHVSVTAEAIPDRAGKSACSATRIVDSRAAMSPLLRRRRRPNRSSKRIAGAAHGADRVGLAAAVERLAQAADMDVDGALVDVDVACPRRRRAAARARTRGPGRSIRNSSRRNSVGPRCDLAAGARHPLLLAVELDVAGAQHVGDALGLTRGAAARGRARAARAPRTA